MEHTTTAEEHTPSAPASPPSEHLRLLLGSLGLAVFAVLALWGILSKGVGALGVNATVFLILLFLLLDRGEERRFLKRGELGWSIPILLLAVSFALYENPFFKRVLVFTLPIAIAFLFGGDHRASLQPWHPAEAGKALFRSLVSPFGALVHAARRFASLPRYASLSASQASLVTRVAIGVATLLALSLLVVLPLLIAADAEFGRRITWIMTSMWALLPSLPLLRIVLVPPLALALSSAALAFREGPATVRDRETNTADSIGAGIVLGGILGLYSFFISVQAERLFHGTLPAEFSQAVFMVKSGFWQLLALSCVNIGIFIAYYRRTTQLVQRFLFVFTTASLVILASAAHRMYLYVTLHGLSYEKFYASYTVLYCAILFGALFMALIRERRVDVIRCGAALALWMFGIVSVLPVERIIVELNVLNRERLVSSRIDLDELMDLSADVAGPILDDPDLRRSIIESSRSSLHWAQWRSRAECRVYRREWFEMNLSSALLYLVVKRSELEDFC